MQFPSISSVFRFYAKDFFKIVLVMAVVAGSVASVLLFVVERDYTSQVQILVIQKYTLTDSYTASKSAEKVSKNLAEVVKTSVFFNDVVAENTVYLSDILALSEEDKRKEWGKKLSTETSSTSSILKITAFDPNRERAEALATTVAKVLIEKGSEYHGAPDTVSLKIIDTALTSEKPESPSVPLYTAAAALFVGFVLSIVVFLKKSSAWEIPSSVAASASLPAMSTPQQTVATSPETHLHVQNFQQKLSSPELEDKGAYLTGSVKTLHNPHGMQDMNDQSKGA